MNDDKMTEWIDNASLESVPITSGHVLSQHAAPSTKLFECINACYYFQKPILRYIIETE